MENFTWLVSFDLGIANTIGRFGGGFAGDLRKLSPTIVSMASGFVIAFAQFAVPLFAKPDYALLATYSVIYGLFAGKILTLLM